MYDLVREFNNLSDAETDFLKHIAKQINLVADLSRADILLYGRINDHESIILSHAQPHSLAHVYSMNRAGHRIQASFRPEVWRALTLGTPQYEALSHISEGAAVSRRAFPICYPPPYPDSDQKNLTTAKPRTIAALVVVTNLIEAERLKLRSKVFQKALGKLQTMAFYGRLTEVEELSPFGEQDGILFIDAEGQIRYISGIASNLFRRIGYRETVLGQHVSKLETADAEFWREAMSLNQAFERETEEGERIFIRKAIPIKSYPTPRWRWMSTLSMPRREQLYGVLITIHDDTEFRQQDQALRTKNAMIQEVHHRVKNNLQTIAGLLRMQIRRTKSEETRDVLDDTLRRILSIAVIHEFLSYEDANIINIKDVSNRIASQLQQGVLDPEKNVRFQVNGKPVYLPARQATASSLILNELLQNAIEHGFENKQAGTIQVDLEDGGDEVMIKVTDDGEGLPEDFDLNKTKSLGLQIIKTLVEGDLKGKLQLYDLKQNGHTGLAVTITFPKAGFEGEEGWKEFVSS